MENKKRKKSLLSGMHGMLLWRVLHPRLSWRSDQLHTHNASFTGEASN
jgi:hypothetical protein